MRYAEHLKVNGRVTCLMNAILVCTMSISKALVHVKATQCPHIALHAYLTCLHRQAEFSLQPDWQSQLTNMSSRSGETAQSEPIGSKVPALISHPNSRGPLSLSYQDWNTRKEYISAEPLVGGRVLSLVIDGIPWRAIICLRRKYLALSRVLNCFTLYIIIINFSPASAMLTLSLCLLLKMER